jgi:hypothetical protein
VSTSELRRRLLGIEVVAGFLVVVAGTALIGLFVAWIVLSPEFRAQQLELPHFPGRVLAVHDSSDSESNAGTVKVRFGFDSDHMQTATIGVGDVGRWPVGDAVTVLVDPESGAVTLPGENYTPQWFKTLAGLVVLSGGAAGGLGAVVFELRVRREPEILEP